MLSAFSTVLTFALMEQKQRWIKLLALEQESRQWHQSVLGLLYSSSPHTGGGGAKASLYLMKQLKLLIN